MADVSAENSEVPTFSAVLHLKRVTSRGGVWVRGSNLWMQQEQIEV